MTASYTDENIKSLQKSIEEKKLLFLCEMGLDPGIDHMSAMRLIHAVKEKGGVITSFISHCGGLVAPESDDNPWHYKISWNPRNVVMAGKAGADYLQDNSNKVTAYKKLFDEERTVLFPGLDTLCWYPNRDSLSYIDLYQLYDAATFIRTTLRYPDFCYGWKKIIDLKLTAEDIFYETTNLTLATFFKLHFEQQGFSDSITTLQQQPDLFFTQLAYLGLHDSTVINKGCCSAMDILQFALEKKLILGVHDKDMILMLHEIEYVLQGKKYNLKSSLLVKGDDNIRTAMAKTVGLPLGIAVKLILTGAIKETGLHIPIIPAIYEPVLKELEDHGIVFNEATTAIN